MPKRSAEEKIEYYSKKLKKLKKKENKSRRRVIAYSDSSDCEEISDVVTYEMNGDNNANIQINNEQETSTSEQILQSSENIQSHNESIAISENTLPSLDPEVLIALGELVPEEVTYGENIHPDLAQRWAPILRKGLTDKDHKCKLYKEYSIPQNCKLFRAPALNPEIAAAVSEYARTRDKKIENSQHQLGVGLTAINRAMTILLANDNKVQAIKCLSDACRILSDLHASETQTRTKSLTQGLEKSFINLIQDSDRDELLFGSGLPEKIKASKAIEKQGSQIKKTDSRATAIPSTSRSLRPHQGNWRGPSRSMLNRGGRGAIRKTPYSHQKSATLSTQQNNFNPSKVWNKPPRAAPRT